jgi:hypothetical protein
MMNIPYEFHYFWLVPGLVPVGSGPRHSIHQIQIPKGREGEAKRRKGTGRGREEEGEEKKREERRGGERRGKVREEKRWQGSGKGEKRKEDQREEETEERREEKRSEKKRREGTGTKARDGQKHAFHGFPNTHARAEAHYLPHCTVGEVKVLQSDFPEEMKGRRSGRPASAGQGRAVSRGPFLPGKPSAPRGPFLPGKPWAPLIILFCIILGPIRLL